MKRFRFSLEGVRQWRSAQVDVELAMLQRLYIQFNRIEATGKQLAAAVADAHRLYDADAEAGAAISYPQLAGLHRYRLHVQRQQELLAREKETVGRQVGAQRRRLLNARRDFRLLDKLKEKARREWEREYDKETESLVSELHLAKLGAFRRCPSPTGR